MVAGETQTMLDNILQIAKAYASLGEAIASQIRLDDPDCEPTPGASSYIRERLLPALDRLHSDLQDAYAGMDADDITHELGLEINELRERLTDRS